MSKNDEGKIIIEKDFIHYLEEDEKEVKCTIHSLVLNPDRDARDEFIGVFDISLEGSKYYQNEEFFIWGNGSDDEEDKDDYSECFVNLPAELEPDEESPSFDAVNLSDMLEYAGLTEEAIK
jgi:hypothetical protein